MILMGVDDPARPSATSCEVDMRTSTIRAWALDQGIPISQFGVIPTRVRDLYIEAMEATR